MDNCLEKIIVRQYWDKQLKHSVDNQDNDLKKFSQTLFIGFFTGFFRGVC